MIDGAHVIVFASDAEATRRFLCDVLELPAIDAGESWLIFALPPTEVAAHPTTREVSHELYLTCDDLETTVADLRAKGVEFVGEPSEHDWGTVITMKVPGAGTLSLYEPKHARPFGRPV